MLPAGLWEHLAEPVMSVRGPLYVAVEDGGGNHAAVVAAAALDDNRIEVVEGWRCEDWDEAIERLELVGAEQPVQKILVGASMQSQMPSAMWPRPLPAGSRETRVGLPLLRDLAKGGMLVHDGISAELEQAVLAARVRELSVGLSLERGDGYAMVKALVWAVHAAAQPQRVPTVY